MAQMIIRNLDQAIKNRLIQKAKEVGISMEAEARQIFYRELMKDTSPTRGLGSMIADRFRDTGLEEELPELHGEAILPMDL